MTLPKGKWPHPDDEIPCLECNGQDNDCSFCLGEKKMTRRMAYSSYIACHGDDLQMGGKHCAKSFSVLADGIAMLLLWQPSEVKIGDMVFRNPAPDATPA